MNSIAHLPTVLLRTAICGLVLLVPTSCNSEHVQHAIRKGDVPMRGVNLGGWLVTEFWMMQKSQLFKHVDPSIRHLGEYQVAKWMDEKWGKAEKNRRFDIHRNTWIREEDIKDIAAAGLNSVRVPIGYWIAGFDKQDPKNRQEWKVYAPNGITYLDKLIKNWAKKHNIAVLISIHGAKGSQNGEHHSSPVQPYKTNWKMEDHSENIANTIDLAWFLGDRYKNEEAFLGLDLLNEPSNEVRDDDLRTYYRTVHNLLRKYQKNHCVLVHAPRLHDQDPSDPQGSRWAEFGLPKDGYVNFWHEWHKYLVFGLEGKSEEWLMQVGAPAVKEEIKSWSGNPVLIGEWSMASPSTAPFTDLEKLRQYGVIMLNALNDSKAGWTFWSWKTDFDGGVNGWSMRSMIRNDVINVTLGNEIHD